MKTGEAALFNEIWNERPHYCTWCGSLLQPPQRADYFDHIKTKGAHPELRLSKDNIRLLCLKCHRKRHNTPQHESE